MSAARAERLRAELAEHDLDALLVTRLANVRWLTGFTGSHGTLLAGPGVAALATDFRYFVQASEQTAECEVVLAAGGDLLRALATRLPTHRGVRLGVDGGDLSLDAHARLRTLLGPAVELVPSTGLVERLRLRKDADEVAHVRATAALADEALRRVLARGLVGRTEREVALDLEYEQRRLGAEAVAFPPIVAAAERGAHPHAEPRDVPIPPDTLVVVDWGARLDGWCSDCTRTFATGELDPRARELYELVAAAQAAALAALRPGRAARAVDGVARGIIAAAGHAEHFGHKLGHGVGLEVHEGPWLGEDSDDVLAAGQVVTVEPGVYVPGAVGVRIEDLVAVTPRGGELLTTIPKALTVVA